MSTAIIPYAQGIGFAIPINSAKRCTGEMTDEGIASRPWLGIIGLSLSQELSRYYDLPLDKGVLVTRVVDGSPASNAGIVMGDIISEMDGVPVRSVEDLLAGVQRRKVGDEVSIRVYHRGSERLIKAKLSKTP
jgi:S1-C subfamily serine protease